MPPAGHFVIPSETKRCEHIAIADCRLILSVIAWYNYGGNTKGNNMFVNLLDDKKLHDCLKNSNEYSALEPRGNVARNIGFVKQNGKYYSIDDLPDGFVVRGDLDLSGMDLSDVNLNIKLMGTLILSGENKTIFPPILDLSNMTYVDLHDTDLSGVHEIKWPTAKIDLRSCRNLPPVLDFSGTKDVDLRRADLSGVREIKGPTNRIDLTVCKHLPPVLDFSATKRVDLSHTDLSGVREIKSPAHRIDLRSCRNLPPVLDFSGTKVVSLSFAVLSGVREIKWPTESISLVSCRNLPPVLDFSGTKAVDLSHTALSGVREIKGPIDSIALYSCENFPPVLDFIGTKTVNLNCANLLGVRETKRSVDLPGHLRQFYDLTFNKIIQRNVANCHISRKR